MVNTLKSNFDNEGYKGWELAQWEFVLQILLPISSIVLAYPAIMVLATYKKGSNMKIRLAKKILKQYYFPPKGKNRYWIKRFQTCLCTSVKDRVIDHRITKAIKLTSKEKHEKS